MAKDIKKATMTEFLREMLDKRWSYFVEMEADPTSYTSNQAVIFSLIRACAKGKLPAIKEALDRIDGRVAIEVEVEYPKFYFLYPAAKSVVGGEPLTRNDGQELIEAPAPTPEPEPEPTPMSNGSLRETLERMSREKRSLVKVIIEAAVAVESTFAAGIKLSPKKGDPLVKSVMIAGLLNMAHNGNLGAIFEVLEQIDGKVADKIKVLGDDVYINVYSEIAPAGATLNENGIYQLTADNTTNAWAASLESQRKKGDGYDSRISR